MNYKMKMKYKQILFIAGLPLLAACSEGPASPLPDAADADVLRVLSVDTKEVGTRSVMTTAELATDGAQIGVYAINPDKTEYLPPRGGSNTAVYTYNSSVWNAATVGTDLLRLPSATGKTVNVYAFYPSDLTSAYQSGGESYVSGVDILSEDDFKATSQADYLYAGTVATGVCATSPAVSFEMNHALVKLTLKVYKSGSLTSTMKLTGLKINDNSGALKGGTGKRMRLSDGQLQGTVALSAITLTAADDAQKTEIVTYTDGSTPTAFAFCLLAPAKVTYLSFLVTTATTGLEAGATTQTQQFLTQQTLMTKTDWKAGEHVVLTIVLDGMKATVTNISVRPWEDYTDSYYPIS